MRRCLSLKWETVSGYDAPGVWVRRVLVNRATSWRRRIRSEGAALTRLGGSPPLTAIGSELDAKRIWLEVRRLPRRQAQAVALYYLDEYSVEEVASVMGCGVPTVKTHLQRARRTLASRLEDLQ
jgi:RNA polymerase sigma-70 factor (ECF subfamily)